MIGSSWRPRRGRDRRGTMTPFILIDQTDPAVLILVIHAASCPDPSIIEVNDLPHGRTLAHVTNAGTWHGTSLTRHSLSLRVFGWGWDVFSRWFLCCFVVIENSRCLVGLRVEMVWVDPEGEYRMRVEPIPRNPADGVDPLFS